MRALRPARDVQLDLDRLLRRLTDLTRLLPALTAENAAEERRRLVACLASGEMPVPSWRAPRRGAEREAWRWLDMARSLAGDSPASTLYLARLDELELELCMIEALGDARRIRPLAARRFGTGRTLVPAFGKELPLERIARAILDAVPDTPEARTVPAIAAPGERSLAAIVRAIAAAAGIDVEVRVEPRLVAGAATGERIVFLAQRHFGPREAVRLAVHEVLGHLVAGANGRTQPLRLFELGTAGSFSDQEGIAIYLEEEAGVLDGYRLRTLAARVITADAMHAGRPFGETARELVAEHGFSPEDAVALSERAYRGGGVARDVGYLSGWLRVRDAIERGDATVDELRTGKVGVADLPELRRLADEGLVRRPRHRPSLAASLRATPSGTSAETSPPSAAASFTRLELT